MKKPFGLLLAVLFLVVQLASTLHMAEHGFSEHKHNGHVCDIYLYCDQGKIAGTPDIDVVPDTTFLTLAPLSFTVSLFTEQRYQSNSPRAPPTLA